jgi:hypothetical protein
MKPQEIGGRLTGQAGEGNWYRLAGNLSERRKVMYVRKILSSPTVFRIHDILVWIRGSMPLANGSGCGSFYIFSFFIIDLQDANKK